MSQIGTGRSLRGVLMSHMRDNAADLVLIEAHVRVCLRARKHGGSRDSGGESVSNTKTMCFDKTAFRS